MKMKYNAFCEEYMELKQNGDLWGAGEVLLAITENDASATNLCHKVLKKDVNSLLEKIQAIFQRESAEIRDVTNVSEIRQLIEWLEYICED